MTIKGTGDLVDFSSDQKLYTIADKAKRLWLMSPLPCFIPGYVVSDKPTFYTATEYLANRLGIKDVYEFELEPSDVNYLRLFLENRGKIEKAKGDTLLVRVTGFDKVDKLQKMSHRTAHDFDQDLEHLLPEFQERYMNKEDNPWPWDVEKRIIIASYLDPLSKNFPLALESALSSDFKTYFWRFLK